MEKSISLQPYVKKVSVQIDRNMLSQNFFGYGELEGRMIIALVQIDFEGEIVSAKLEYDAEKKYPLMRLI